MSFYLSNKDYKEMIGIISGDTGSKKGNGASTTYLDTEFTAQEPKKQQGIVADTVDAVQMGAWKGVSDIAHGIGALTGADWLHDVGDWAAKGADENLATMSDEMKTALNQNAFDGEGQGVRNLRWWAGNLGSLIGQNLDAALTLGAGKVATIGAKQAGKLLLKKEVAEEVGKTAVEQAAKRGIPQKYWNMVGITATMSAMSGGGRYGQKRDEVMGMTNEQLAQIPQFSDEYYSIADSDEGKGKSTDELYTMAKKSFADKVGREAALNPTAIATDLVTNAVSGLGGGFWGLGSPAKTIKGGLLKGAAVEGGTEAIQGIGEQYALNKADQDYLNPNKDLTEGMADNAINGAVLGAVFGSAMGGLDTHTDRMAFNNQKRTILNHINTGNEAVDSQLRNYIDMLNHGATELGDLVSASRVQALNNAGIATAKARQAAEEALAEQQAKAKFESDFFDEEQPQQETTSTFKVDPNLERALELHSILGQFRKNDLSRANEFIDTPTIFADEQARKDYVIGRAFDEVRNIAQSYGIDPKDGKAMRRWLEDYAEKAKEYTNNTQEQETIESNSQVDNAKTGNAEYQTAVGDQSPNSHNQEVDFNNITPQDLLQPINAPQSDINLADQYLSVNSSEPIQEIDANQLSSELPSSEYESAINITNQNLFNPLNQNQSIQQLEDSAPLDEIYTNGAVQDIGNSDTDIRLSLNEDENSDFAKVVEDVFGSTNTQVKAESIYLGTTPKALIESGLDDLPMFMNKQKLVKIKHEHPEMTADLLKQIPQQINNPVAVFKNTKEGSPNNSYVVLTELQGTNGNPVISAIHANKTERGLEFHRIASVYGRNESSNYLTNMVKHSEVRFVDKQKARRINHTLQLLTDDTLNELFNRASVVKSDGSVNTLNPEIQHAQDIIRKTFGKAAEHIEVATFANPPKDVRHLITSDVEGWFNPKTGKVTLIADSINATKTMSKEERLQFVAWHEMAHRGINVGYKGSYDSLMQEVGKNKAISQIADAIQAQRKNTDDLAATNRAVAIEEAIAEMMAAHETGKWNELESRYGVEIKKGQRQSTKSWLAMTAQRIKDFLSKFFGVERAAQFSDEDVLNLLAGIKRNMDGDNSNSSATDNTGAFSKDSDDIRFSRANTTQSALELSQSALAESEPSLWDDLKAKDYSSFKERFNRAVGKVDEWLADSLRPVNDWIDSMHLEDQTGNTSSRDHEKRRLKDAMYTAKGKRDALNSELEQAYLKPILSKIAALSKETKKSRHPIDELTMKRMVGNWISARYSIEKNIDLLNRDEKVMRDTKRLLDNAKQNGTSAEVRRLNEAYLKAKEQYDNRKADIYNTDYKNKGNRFKVGVAGGWSIPEAELIMSNTEKHISRSNLEYVADLVYDLNQSRLDIDRASGRYTEAEYQEYKTNRHYVPLTGDPNADADVDIISGAGSNALNIARDKTLKGRTSSEAEDAIDAVWKSIGKSTTYAGFAEFKSRIDDFFETEVALLKDKGYSDAEAREQATANLGISKRKMQGLTRSSDNVLIRKEGSDYYEYELPSRVMESLRNDNVEHANAFLKLISKPTGWYARGVTQWTVTFAPMNMMRDTWEKSEFIRVQKLYDKNNRLVDSKTMDKIGRDTIKNAFADKEVWQATKRLGFGQELRDIVPEERMLKQLLKDGGVSNYGTYLDKTEVDLIKRLKKENNPMAGKLEKAGKVLEGYNKMFDTVSALASYKALVENGIDSKQAAATTLELTNFRKTGSKMRGIKALYMFSQPTVMGAANLMRYLSTRKGQIRFAAYMAVMTSLYTVLRSMDDEDEGGNKIDQLGDITRYIPIPLGEGKYFKIPVGFGMAQMAWNFSTNIVKGAVGDISMTEAGTNMFVHSLKTFSPVSPSEISAAKYPMEKAALTITPSILQPLVQNALNRSAFGGQITTNYVSRDKLKAEQSKVTTAQFWKDTAIYLNDSLGIDMHPEQIKNLFDGYGAMLGSLRELNTILVENPNREQLGRKTRTPLLNQFIGTTNEFAIQSRYYEASEEARKVKAEYESRKERKALDGWLDNDKIKMIKFSQEEESIIKQARAEKSNLTRALRSGQISAVAYENGIKRYNKEMSGVQARLLRKYRQMEGLNTH